MTKPAVLPEFVQHQAARAWQQLLEHYPDIPLTSKFYKTALVVSEVGPHPNHKETVELPVGLINWRQEAWHLYFRSTQGRWLLLPDMPASKHPQPLLLAIVQDNSGIFWRQ